MLSYRRVRSAAGVRREWSFSRAMARAVPAFCPRPRIPRRPTALRIRRLAAAFENLLSRLGNFVQVPRSAEQIDVGGFGLDPVVVTLGHAADDADDHAGAAVLDFGHLAEAAVNLVLGVLADAARVEQDTDRLPDILGRLVTHNRQLPEDQLAVEHVHLTAESFEIDGFLLQLLITPKLKAFWPFVAHLIVN